MAVTSETATVYRSSDGRRYFTKRAAVRKDIYRRLRGKERHEKQGCHDELIGGEHHQEEFYTEEQLEHFRAVAYRYWRIFSRRIG